ncbi:MYG1 family protein [Lachnobacterium bovis]|uniref:Uncharacterized protein, UPF0160 family n=3 Tax=Lachnobacterium bovis TaxID=140626 RepID=A0A1H9QHE0_9FIRM|nr:MYG1 family protein [Lachnobacterium bovis]SER59971.1 Uncharacterized protein, UPF0160 family [Lachnobacterium bovis]
MSIGINMKENSYILNVKNAYTHAGSFHSDDVFATAFLQILNPNITVHRIFKCTSELDGIIYDIGWGEFDHHQKDKRYRENEVPYAAFGLLWEKFGTLIMDEESAQKFDEYFIQPLDLSDNTGCDNDFAMAISDFNPKWDEDKSTDEAFFEAVSFAKGILERRFEKTKSNLKAREIVREELSKLPEDIEIFELQNDVPWKSAVKDTNIKYVIYKSNRGGYNIQCVPSDEDKDELKKALPEEWRGKTQEELEELTNVKGFRFCHNSGFLCAAETIEGARAIAKMALEF